MRNQRPMNSFTESNNLKKAFSYPPGHYTFLDIRDNVLIIRLLGKHEIRVGELAGKSHQAGWFKCLLLLKPHSQLKCFHWPDVPSFQLSTWLTLII